jgi:Flp pilus assembly protein TadG
MPFILMVLFFVTISVVVGVVAKLLNGLAEANAVRRAEEERAARAARMERAATRARETEDERAERPRAAADRNEEHGGGTVRPATSDMDRFLAEIDRLRRKAAANPNPPPEKPAAAPVAPVVQPTRPPSGERPRARVVAELAEPPAYGSPSLPPPSPASSSVPSFGTSPQAPTRDAPVGGQVEQLPVAQVLRPSSSTGAPATKVTRFQNRPRPASKTNFGKNLTAMLASGQGVAMAVVLQEILGAPKCKKNAASAPPAPQPEPTPPTEPSPNGH